MEKDGIRSQGPQWTVVLKVEVKAKLDRPFGLQEVENLREFLNSQHMKVVRLSALHTNCLYLPEDNPGTHFC